MNSNSKGGEWKDSATLLQEIGAIKFGKFTLTSGKTSPYYVDLRLAPSHPEVLRKLRNLCVEIIQKIDDPVDKLAGVPTSGLPLATAVGLKLDLPLIFARKNRKLHGGQKLIEGSLNPGEKVLLIDDVATTGGSIESAAEKIKECGGEVHHAVVVIDRNEGAREKLKAKGLDLHACMEIDEVVKHLHDAGILEERHFSSVMNYLHGN
ncbi:hypothetical protein AKJ45_03370 [candidate division MSBL1 archaeon SCGC-AAA261F19]|uniref:Orotate phosphoribosyltransferase n=2 Tax=candidate division MSBL1 TaxID=215777 RepID=A0A133V8B9_9EURY|nr:hypothetical protein AKJ45_03370 [candidate division MSBL1 archaeon SCGC-AAA261F19]KXB02877.1 hypothetical protein AKJ43_00055 [candidate division MSBL1 archaeon SCGC-AAA261D19]